MQVDKFQGLCLFIDLCHSRKVIFVLSHFPPLTFKVPYETNYYTSALELLSLLLVIEI